MIRTLWAGLNLLIGTFIWATIIISGGIVKASGEWFTWASSTWARWVLWGSGVRVKLVGVENLPPDKPLVLVANHSSWYDVFALAGWLPKRYRFIAKIELSRIPMFGRAWLAAGHIAIDRADRAAALAALDRAAEIVREDNSAIVIFPEGTRSEDGKLLPFKKGGFMVALRTGVDIVPVAIFGSRHVQPKGSWRIRSGLITIVFGSPIPSTGYDERDRDGLMNRVRDELAAMLEQPALSSR